MSDLAPDASLAAVPLFPLPNVVLFPRAVLPLHIFEERYKAMTAHVLASDKRLAMALLLPGWEKHYYARPAIDPVVCVGQILSWERLPDGRYNFLLQGVTRARVVREHGKGPYRVAELEPLREIPALDIDLEQQRATLAKLFACGPLANLPLGKQFRELLAGPMSTPAIADLAAFNFIEDLPLRQQLLKETNVRHRVATVVESLTRLAPCTPPIDPSMN